MSIKCLPLLLLLFLAAALCHARSHRTLFLQQQCYEDCAAAGQACDPQAEVPCQGSNYCQQNTADQFGTCAPFKSIGSTCDIDDECGPLLSPLFGCEGGSCVKYSKLGEACLQHSDCLFNGQAPFFTLCSNVSHTCVLPAAGLAGEGSLCSSSTPCQAGLYCQPTTGICQPRAEVDAACTPVGGAGPYCLSGSLCFEGICVEQFSLQEGSRCDVDSLCKSGLLCLYPGYSTGFNLSLAVCARPSQATSSQSCQTNRDCPLGFSCGCAGGAPKCIADRALPRRVVWAISDFSDFMQSHLTDLSAEGFFTYYTDYLSSYATGYQGLCSGNDFEFSDSSDMDLGAGALSTASLFLLISLLLTSLLL